MYINLLNRTIKTNNKINKTITSMFKINNIIQIISKANNRIFKINRVKYSNLKITYLNNSNNRWIIVIQQFNRQHKIKHNKNNKKLIIKIINPNVKAKKNLKKRI